MPGKDGSHGTKGAMGPQGPVGPQGERGLPGPRGKPGAHLINFFSSSLTVRQNKPKCFSLALLFSLV
jgi:hypothetical protein